MYLSDKEQFSTVFSECSKTVPVRIFGIYFLVFSGNFNTRNLPVNTEL